MSKADGHPVCILMAFNESYFPIARITVPVLMKYAKKHGYVVHGGDHHYHEDPTNLRDYGDRGKLDLFMQVYNDFDIVMWLDADALVMNHNQRIEDTLGSLPFLWACDPNGPNSAFWIARTTPLVRQTLLTVQRRAQRMGKVEVREHLGPPHKVVIEMEPRGTSDQTTMRSMMAEPPFDKVLGRNCFFGREAGFAYHSAAAYDWQGLEENIEYRPGDWIVSCPGLLMGEKIGILQELAKNAG